MNSEADRMTRRTFVAQSGLIVGGSALLLSGCKPSPTATWMYFTPEEADLIKVLSSRIIPTDDSPGAVEAGVVHFIDQQLATHYRRWSLVYREALKVVQTLSQTQHGKPFQDLNPAQMDVLLEQMESATVPDALNPGRILTRFFHLLVDHCMQGFYGDPRHGGNLNWVSYEMLDLRVIDPKTVVPQSS